MTTILKFTSTLKLILVAGVATVAAAAPATSSAAETPVLIQNETGLRFEKVFRVAGGTGDWVAGAPASESIPPYSTHRIGTFSATWAWPWETTARYSVAYRATMPDGRVVNFGMYYRAESDGIWFGEARQDGENGPLLPEFATDVEHHLVDDKRVRTDVFVIRQR